MRATANPKHGYMNLEIAGTLLILFSVAEIVSMIIVHSTIRGYVQAYNGDRCMLAYNTTMVYLATQRIYSKLSVIHLTPLCSLTHDLIVTA